MNSSGKTVGQLPDLRYLSWVLTGLGLLSIIHAVPVFLSTPNKAKESMAKSILEQMMQEQQQFYTQNGAFLAASRNLASYEAAYGTEKLLYRFSTRPQNDRVYSYATPIQEYEFGRFFVFPWNRLVGLKSYVGVVVVSDRKMKVTQFTLCPIHSPMDEITLTQSSGGLSCRSTAR